jgi:hypothetical protein
LVLGVEQVVPRVAGVFFVARLLSANCRPNAMQTRLTLRPGQRGTKKLIAEYGDKLLCIRYRYDPQRKKRYKTVELIVEEIDWKPKPDALVAVKVEWGETELGRQVRRAGGNWNAAKKVWEMRYDRAVELGLEKRIKPLETQTGKVRPPK